jgi:phage N-6-adenine-methyltransferase
MLNPHIHAFARISRFSATIRDSTIRPQQQRRTMNKSPSQNFSVHFSSKTDMWATPMNVFNEWNERFRFSTDVCAVPSNAKCENFFTPEQDGLAQDWKGVCWMNPPYGRGIGAWVTKAHDSALKNGATVVCLLPARTDTRWWHDHCMAGEITFIRGRIKFGDAKTNAPFPSAVVVFRPPANDNAPS